MNVKTILEMSIGGGFTTAPTIERNGADASRNGMIEGHSRVKFTHVNVGGVPSAVGYISGRLTVGAVARKIQSLINKGTKAAEKASLPFYLTAGELLIQVKEQMPHGGFMPFVADTCKIDHSTATRYMSYAKAFRDQQQSVRDAHTFSKFTHPNRDPSHRPKSNVLFEQLGALADEKRLRRIMAEEFIKCGYHAMQKKLHPDTGATDGRAAQRLNAVRDDVTAAVNAYMGALPKVRRMSKEPGNRGQKVKS